jgi:tRNA pseudouridine32 synthase / 23S rRNA pseudouridine746 synthase
VIPGRGEKEETLLDLVSARLGGKAWVTHRLDRGASGLVVFAKDAETHRRLSKQFEGREIAKTYLAVVRGDVAAGGVIDQPLRVFGSGRVGVDAARGKPSLTRYRVKDNFAGVTLLEVSPETGRQHQIRVHLYWLGHPILGETRYGKDFPVGGAPRLLLHAWKLSIPRPDGEALALEAPPPEDFRPYLFRT